MRILGLLNDDSPLMKATLVIALRKSRYRKYFRTSKDYGIYGVFRTFEEARQEIPAAKVIGFDTKEAATMYDDRLAGIFPYDYPVLFWLRPLMTSGLKILDIGGHIGVAFYTYSSYIDFPNGLEWVVKDMPEICNVGRELAARRGVAGLSFVSELSLCKEVDVLLTAGAIQYVNGPGLAEIIKSLDAKPRHVIVNKIPLHETMSFVTLENFGAGYTPFHVHKRSEFIESMLEVGYRLRDAWKNPDHRLFIPFYPEHSLKAYSGLYFVSSDDEPRQGR